MFKGFSIKRHEDPARQTSSSQQIESDTHAHISSTSTALAPRQRKMAWNTNWLTQCAYGNHKANNNPAE